MQHASSLFQRRLLPIRSHFFSTVAKRHPVVSFIGGGNMAEAILAGLQASGHPGSHLRFSEPQEERRKYMETRYPNLVSARDNGAAVEGADIVVIAVKPQVYQNVFTSLGPSLLKNPSTLVISIAGGITSDAMSRWISSDSVPIVRCMPNTPALIGEGAVGLYANTNVDTEQRSATESIMHSIAKQVTWVKQEPLIDAVTGVSGSGPAYFFLVMEAMQNAGIEAGLSPEEAKALTLQTCVGAARMAQESDDDLATLRRKVTSPNGTTEAAVKSLESNNIRRSCMKQYFLLHGAPINLLMNYAKMYHQKSRNIQQ